MKTEPSSTAGFIKVVLMAAIISMVSFISIFADGKITSVSINPPNPTYGDLAVVTVKLCASEWQAVALAMAIST